MSNQNLSFSSDVRSTEEGDINEKCPSCNTPFSDHTTSQLVKCALAELKGGRKN